MILLKRNFCQRYSDLQGGCSDLFIYVRCVLRTYENTFLCVILHNDDRLKKKKTNMKAFPNAILSRHFTATSKKGFGLLFLDKSFCKSTKKYLRSGV